VVAEIAFEFLLLSLLFGKFLCLPMAGNALRGVNKRFTIGLHYQKLSLHDKFAAKSSLLRRLYLLGRASELRAFSCDSEIKLHDSFEHTKKSIPG